MTCHPPPIKFLFQELHLPQFVTWACILNVKRMTTTTVAAPGELTHRTVRWTTLIVHKGDTNLDPIMVGATMGSALPILVVDMNNITALRPHHTIVTVPPRMLLAIMTEMTPTQIHSQEQCHPIHELHTLLLLIQGTIEVISSTSRLRQAHLTKLSMYIHLCDNLKI
jgi:hypothetical protein